MDTRDKELLQRLQLGQLRWNRPKIEVVCSGKVKRLVLPLLVILVVTPLAYTIRHELDVEPSLFAAGASFHLLSGKCLVEFSLDRYVFW
jgi:hypothetical protein